MLRPSSTRCRSSDTRRALGYDRLLLAAALGAALITLALDLALLESKYDVFRGGFLQAHQIQGPWRIAAFLLTILAIELLFFGVLAGAWGAIGRGLGLSSALAAYHFLLLVGGTSVAIIGLRYQLLGYFSDYMSFAVLKSLGGGSLSEAIAFGLEEGRLFALAVGAGALVYVGGHVVVCRRLERSGAARPLAGFARAYLASSLAAGVALAAVILLVNRDEHFRHHLDQVTAYAYPRELLDTLTDFDRDGYGLFAWSVDPRPLDPSVYPGALDIPGDGIDQDGLLGDFVYTPRPRALVSFPGRRLHLIVIVLESTRADVLDANLNGRPVAPVMRELARTGAADPLFYSHTGFTSSSIKALFSGSLSGLPVFGTSLFTVLKEQGYNIAVVSGQNESFGGMAQALRMRETATIFFDASRMPWERVFPSTAPGSLTLSNARVLRQFDEVVESFGQTHPVFAYINLQSPHFPYHHPGMPILLDGVTPLPRSEIGPGARDALRRTYWNAVANADAAVGEIISRLRARGVLGDSVVVVCGDHGESLFDDGLLGHGHQVNDIQTRALLVSNRRVPALAGLLGQTDLALELLRAAGARLDVPGGPPSAAPPTNPREVFQIVGPLDHPAVIGFVDADRRRVLFNPRSNEAFFDTLGRWVRLADVGADPGQAARLRALILEWERLRWEQYLAATGQAAAPAGR